MPDRDAMVAAIETHCRTISAGHTDPALRADPPRGPPAACTPTALELDRTLGFIERPVQLKLRARGQGSESGKGLAQRGFALKCSPATFVQVLATGIETDRTEIIIDANINSLSGRGDSLEF